MRGRLGRGLQSLRWRLTLTYIAMLGLLLIGLGTFQYVTLRSSLITSRADTLSGDVAAARALYSRGLPRALTVNAAATRFATAITTVGGRSVSVVIFDQNGTEIASSAAPPEIPRLDAPSLRNGVTAPQELDTAGGGSYLVTAYKANVSNLGQMTLELATPMESIDTVLWRTTFLFSLGSFAALVLALGIGLWLTSRSLRPLRRLTETAGELAEGDLAARSRLAHGDNEVGTLGRAFDEMAERIEDAFHTQAESEATMRRFIADASHELRTPVTSLKGYIDVMRRGAGRDPGALDAILESMQREADRMRGLVLDLLTLARLDAQTQMSAEEVDVNQVIGAILDEGVPGMPGSVTREFASPDVIAKVDKKALITIIRNLLVNGCKYAPGAAQTWTTSAEGAFVVIRARDDGPGIPAADLPHVFERFYRGEKTRAREEGGSGLGLSIVQTLARTMGGDVTIASKEGAGTTVTVTLPRAPVVADPGV